MKKTISLHDFVSAFTEMGRYDQFSLEGLKVIYKYITDYESESGQEIELDVIAICRDFAESEPMDIARDYSIGEAAVCAENVLTIVREYLKDKGVLLGETDSTFVYRQF